MTHPTVRAKKWKVSYLTLRDDSGGFKNFKDVVDPIKDTTQAGLEWSGDIVKLTGDGKCLTIRMTCTKVPMMINKGAGDTGSLSVTLTDGTTPTTIDNLPVTYTDDDPCQ
jgi:hypothetical protein